MTPDMLFLLDNLTWRYPSVAAFLAQDIFATRINEATALADGWDWDFDAAGVTVHDCGHCERETEPRCNPFTMEVYSEERWQFICDYHYNEAVQDI